MIYTSVGLDRPSGPFEHAVSQTKGSVMIGFIVAGLIIVLWHA